MIGEGPRTAKALSKQLGIPNYRHSVRTEDLMREIQLLQTHGNNVALFANLPEDSDPMKQADCPILPRFGKIADPSLPSDRHPSSYKTIDVSETNKNSGNKTSSMPLPAVIVRSLSVLPATRKLLQNILAIVKQNTIISFLGPLLILPASSGLLVTVGHSFPAPWLVAFATLPGLAAVIVNAVRMGRQLTVISGIPSGQKKGDFIHEP